MALRVKFYGPPGTAKTTQLLNCVGGELAQGVRPEQIIYTSFTRAAAREARDRAISKFQDYHPDDFPWFSTIHSICFRLLGLGKDSVFAGKKLDEFCNIYGYKISKDEVTSEYETELHEMVLQTDADYFEHFINLQRNLMIDFDTAYNLFTRQMDVPNGFGYEQLKAYITRRNEYKKENELWDYCDMIEVVFDNGLCPQDIKVMLSDEFQDLTPLLAKVTDMWSKKVERYYFAGDPYQAIYCLPNGTIIDCLGGNKQIESVVVGDNVICAMGAGRVDFGNVIDVSSHEYNGELVKITTQSGKEIFSTPGHIMFWNWSPTIIQHNTNSKWWYVYLMKMGDKWRIGKTDNPLVRLRFEHGAEGILPIMAFTSEEEALVWEEIYSLKYGIPTTVFYYRGNWDSQRSISKKAQDTIFANVDSANGASQVMQDLDKAWEGHIRPMAASSPGVKRSYVHLMALYHDHDNFRRYIYWNRIGKNSARGSKYLRDLHEARRYAHDKSVEIGGEVFEKWAFTSAHIYIPTPSSNILPGCSIPVYSYGEIIDDMVIKTEHVKYNGMVYDLQISPSNNFVANGIFVHNTWMGADPSIFIKARTDKTLVLKQSYRCPQAVHDLSRTIVSRFRNRYQDDDYIPKDKPGAIIRAVPRVIDWNNLDGKIFYLHRTHWLLSQAFNDLLFDGIPFATVRGRKSPLQTPKAGVVNSVFKLLNLKYVPINDVAKIMDYLPSKTLRENYLRQGAKVECKRAIQSNPYRNVSYRDLQSLGFTSDFFAYFKPEDILTPFKLSIEEKAYFAKVIRKYGPEVLESEPKVTLGTIHSVKGRECDVCILNLNLTRKTYGSLLAEPDAEHRLFYVGVTRSKNKVILLEPENYQSYRL